MPLDPLTCHQRGNRDRQDLNRCFEIELLCQLGNLDTERVLSKPTSDKMYFLSFLHIMKRFKIDDLSLTVSDPSQQPPSINYSAQAIR